MIRHETPSVGRWLERRPCSQAKHVTEHVHQAESPSAEQSTGSTTVPDKFSLIGVDGEGATHYLGNRVTHEGVPVYVEKTDGSVVEWDLTETPCAECDDIVEGWINHVERKRGTWERLVYGQSLGETLVEAVEEADG